MNLYKADLKPMNRYEVLKNPVNYACDPFNGRVSFTSFL